MALDRCWSMPQEMHSMPTKEVNGNQLYYEIAGEGPPLVLVHGSWDDHHDWDGVVPPLAESYTVVTYDRRGHSQSAAPAGQGSVNDDVEDLVGLIDALKLAPAHIAGISFGASIVLRTACAHPESFRTAAVHEPPLMDLIADDPALAEPLQVFEEAIEPVQALLSRGEHADAARLFAETVAIGPGGWEQMSSPDRGTWVNNAPAFLDELRDPEAFTVDLIALGAFSHPTLLSHGEQSPPFFPAIVARIARTMSHAQLYAFADAGHVPHLSHPDEYLNVLTRFLAGESG
jgi:pimeloyl-ACP methyl ester carboxylesterase